MFHENSVDSPKDQGIKVKALNARCGETLSPSMQFQLTGLAVDISIA